MTIALINQLLHPSLWLKNPMVWMAGVFQIWMLIHAVRQREWLWALFIFFGSILGTFWYFFSVYQPSRSSMSGFELPGAASRARIKELERQIHHLDKAYHHFQLGDVYFRKGKLEKAEACYRAALEREPDDIDFRAHLGQCLLRQKRAAEAKPILEKVCAENSRHDYGYSMMALAETYTALGEKDRAMDVWQHVLENNSYARARVQLAEIYMEKGQPDLARKELQEVLSDDAHAPKYQRKRDRVWTRRAKRMV
jgi:hypothetical protein